ncbi:MAG: RNA polymerase sigma factor (sigma-70 family) [Verrucomicrobiales bacterium]|jgi:RNA polymerase sigma factor (sigma-70 family)
MAEVTDSFDDWFRAEHPRVLSAVLIVCAGDVAKAEDATNDAFVSAYEKWDRVGAMDSPRAWVVKVAINRAKRSFVRRRPHVPLVNDDTALIAAVDPAVDHELWAAVSRLSTRQRAAVVLRYVDDLPQAAIADALDIAPGTVAATLSHARRNLRIELEGEAS